MRAEVLEETVRLEIEQQAERFGVNYYELSPNVQSWLRSLVNAQLCGRDTAPAVSGQSRSAARAQVASVRYTNRRRSGPMPEDWAHVSGRD